MGLFDLFRKNNSDEDTRVIYNDGVDYDSLDQHEYDDSPGYTFYTCPRCGGEYLATFMFEEDGETVCVDCAS